MKYIWQHESWPKLTWDTNALVKILGQAWKEQSSLLERMKAVGFDLSPSQQGEILIEEAVKTSAIEGENLDLARVRSSVMRKLGLPAEGLPKKTPDVDGLVSVLMDATGHYEEPLTAKKLKAWQAALFPGGTSGFKKILTGEWRDDSEPMQVVSGPVGREKVHYEAPPGGERLEREMKEFLSWWHEQADELDGVLRAGVAHFWFVTLHPFEDGNGRIARALTDKALAQAEETKIRFYSLSSQIMKEREDYYRVLELTQKRKEDITPWLEWFIGCFLHAVENAGELLSGVLNKGEFWKKHNQLNLNERQRKVLNRLLDAGPGNFQGGLTTRKYVSIAGTSRATAFREIQDLVDKKLLVPNQAGGRSVSYTLVLE